MLGRNGNIAYVRYDHQGRIVPGGPIIQAKPPKNGNWQAVSNVIGNNWVGPSGSSVLRAFVRIDAFNRVVPSSLLLLNKEPENANTNTTWLEINAQYRGIQESLTCTSATQEDACIGCPSGGTTYLYSNNVPANGVAVFLDRNRTIPYDTGLFGNYARITNQNVAYFIADGTNVLTLGTNCPTTTTTSSSTTTTTTTFAPVNFDFTLTCDGTINRMTANNPTGGSGVYQFTTGVYGTEQGALNASAWSSPTTVQLYGGFNNDTYWVACRDINNPANIIAKSVVANCQPTTTTTSTTFGPLVYIDGYLKYETSGMSTPFKMKYSSDGVNWSMTGFPQFVGGYPNGNLYSPIAMANIGSTIYIAVTDMSDNDINFGIGFLGAHDTYCGISNPYTYTVLPVYPPYSQSIYVNIAASGGQLVQC